MCTRVVGPMSRAGETRLRREKGHRERERVCVHLDVKDLQSSRRDGRSGPRWRVKKGLAVAELGR